MKLHGSFTCNSPQNSTIQLSVSRQRGHFEIYIHIHQIIISDTLNLHMLYIKHISVISVKKKKKKEKRPQVRG